MADFATTDPLGNHIVLHDHTWDWHIIRAVNHPELAPHRADVEAALSKPECIVESTQDSRCRLYFGPVTGRPGLRVQVVADYVRGFVKTAHFVKQVKGGVQVWP